MNQLAAPPAARDWRPIMVQRLAGEARSAAPVSRLDKPLGGPVAWSPGTERDILADDKIKWNADSFGTREFGGQTGAVCVARP